MADSNETQRRKSLLLIAQSCAAENVRRSARLLNQLYGAEIERSGLTGNQFSLLVAISLRSPLTIGELSDTVHIDRTTLTRNLRILRERKFISLERGADRRQQVISLRAEGRRTLTKAIPRWQSVQKRIEKSFGADRLNSLIAELGALRNMIIESAADKNGA